jgi:hypothetical protein
MRHIRTLLTTGVNYRVAARRAASEHDRPRFERTVVRRVFNWATLRGDGGRDKFAAVRAGQQCRGSIGTLDKGARDGISSS